MIYLICIKNKKFFLKIIIATIPIIPVGYILYQNWIDKSVKKFRSYWLDEFNIWNSFI